MKLDLRSGQWKVDVESSGDRGIHWVHLVGAAEGAQGPRVLEVPGCNRWVNA